MAIRYWLASLIALLLVSAVFLFLGALDSSAWKFILKYRTVKFIGLLVVSVAIAVSTLLFQTITQNPILTPSILGFDALFILVQTVLLFMLGAIHYTDLNLYFRFFLEVFIMVFAAFILFRTLIIQSKTDLTRMILIGVIFGVLFRSMSSFLHRLMNPDDFLILQTEMFASFNSINSHILLIATLISMLSLFFVWRWRFILDIMMLGRNHAISLGVNYDRNSYKVLTVIAILVSTSTALVGPVSFFGLLVVAMINGFVKSFHHSIRLPLVAVFAALIILTGQVIFEHVLKMQGTLSIAVDFLGGLVFLWLLYQRRGLEH